MDFYLNDEQLTLQQMCRNIGIKEIRPVAAKHDRDHTFPKETVDKLAELGLMGIYVPSEYGGAGMDFLSYILAVEEISRYCASTGVIISAHTSLAIDPIYRFGTKMQKEKYLPSLALGKNIGCIGLTEPNAGTDVSGIITTANLDKSKNEWIINGQKSFITNGNEAEVCVLFARTDPHPHRGLTAFIVHKQESPFVVGKCEEKMGICASSTTSLIFEDCRVPAENVLGEPGLGFKIAMETLNGGRIGIAAQALGIAQAALDDSIQYSKTRKQFDKTLSSFQAIQWQVADMATRIEAARLLLYRAASLKDQGENYIKESAMAKLYASETATFCAHKAIQIHGGYGYIKEFAVERYYRDARITEIYEGTSEAQRMVIAKSFLN
ncbi:MAG: acyl-CoA dehydrogenase [Oligoflexia bacterium]|nr:acyl-CoA dehydrogenase [Oligoflexia bacterium]